MAGIVSSILTFPFAPIRVVTGVAKILQRQAEQELYQPGAARRQLEELDEERAAGAISDDEYEEKQQAVLDRLINQGDQD